MAKAKQVMLERGMGSVHLLNFRWLTTLRWAAVVGQTLAICVVHFGLEISLLLAPLGSVIASEILLGIAAVARGKKVQQLSEREVASWVAADLAAFAALLFFSGGTANPFSFFFIVHVAMAALTLSPPYTWSLGVLSVLVYAALLPWHMPMSRGGTGPTPTLLSVGGPAAYALGTCCVVYFMLRARAALKQREAMLAEQRELRVNAERLSSLATLAAGAAHELASPLGTIAITAQELAYTLRQEGNEPALEDVTLMRSQVERCRKILIQMAHTAGEVPGESDQWRPVILLVRDAVSELAEAQRIETDFAPDSLDAAVLAPPEALAQALKVLLDNALAASRAQVVLSTRWVEAPDTATEHARHLTITVQDTGAGIPANILKRVFEPFFTTKATGKGMGLGLYLARNIVERLGGSLQLRSAPQQGTTAAIVLPTERLRLARTP